MHECIIREEDIPNVNEYDRCCANTSHTKEIKFHFEKGYWSEADSNDTKDQKSLEDENSVWNAMSLFIKW